MKSESLEEFLKRGGKIRKVARGYSEYKEHGPLNQSQKQLRDKKKTPPLDVEAMIRGKTETPR